MKKIFAILFTLLCIGVKAQMLPISDMELIKTSEDIVKGTVISSQAKWVNNGKFIYTFTKVIIEENISGSYKAGDTVTIVAPGGYDPIKQLGMRVSNQALFENGENVVVFLVKAQGETDAIDYSFLRNDPELPTQIMRINGYSQGKRKIFTDQNTQKLMIEKPNEERAVEFQQHQAELQQEIKKIKQE